MGTSGTESCEGCPLTQFKHLLPQPALKLTLVRLNCSLKSGKRTILEQIIDFVFA